MGEYTAIVYFHGIGTQRRHEDISRLLDAVDQYAGTQDSATIGAPRGQEVKFEVQRAKNPKSPNEPVSYIDFHRRIDVPEVDTAQNAQKKTSPSKAYQEPYRLYEGYWSSIIAKGLPARHVLKWIAGRATNPISSLLVPWRAHQRLKLGYLFRLHKTDPLGGTHHNSLYRELAKAYSDFEAWDARRKFKQGSFKEFIGPYLDGSPLAKQGNYESVKEIVKKWRRRFVLHQIKIFAMFMTLFAGLAGLLTFALFSIAPLLSKEVFNIPFAAQVADAMPTQPDIRLVAVMLPVLAFFAWRMRGFLQNYMADVVFWTAREGKSDLFDQRQVILNTAVETLEHVLSDEDCTRVVVMGHSLGSSVGYQALLEIWKRRDAMGRSSPAAKKRYPYENISHFITAGSPIETLHYFFELTDSKHHRFNRIANTLKGSIEDPPFTLRNKTAIKWINLHAAADPISTELFSPGKSKFPDIEEIEVVSQFEPHAGKAHSGYFTALTSVARLHDAIMLNDKIRTIPLPQPTWARTVARRAVGCFWGLVTLMSWTLLLAAILFWSGQTVWLNYVLTAFLGQTSLLALGWLALKSLSHAHRLNLGDA